MGQFTNLETLAADLPRRYPGPGGACAVLRQGEVVLRHSWGWANAERRIAFTPASLFRICSITKHFTCGLVLDAFPDPTVLNPDVAAALPHLGQPPPSTLHLCHNQSGLRDYWAVAMLQGAPAERAFGDAEAAMLIGATQSLQFTPGTRYSYCNQNFRILSDILQQRTGSSFADLLRRRIFTPAGMQTALLAANTSAMPDGTVGYEGNAETGFREAVNAIHWTGDAGIGASLNDMIAWEQHIDATRDDAAGLYRRLAAPVTFADGEAASYGFGLGRRRLFGRETTGHGGALRGWRSHRLHMPAERLSVLVMFNHLSDAHDAALALLAAALGETPPAAGTAPAPHWLGAYTDPETGLAARIDAAGPGQIRLRFGHSPERLDMQPDTTAGTDGTTLSWENGALVMRRPAENQVASLVTRTGVASRDVAGRYQCAELTAVLTVIDAGGALYGAFSGSLGQGRMEQLVPIAADLWALPCPRALDHTPPGDWTLSFLRDASGAAIAVQVGCWLARGLIYRRN